nr:hypothetical protein [Amycolatopsis sp. WAC 04169]
MQHYFFRFAKARRFGPAALCGDFQCDEYPVERCATPIAVVATSDQVTPVGEIFVGPELAGDRAEQGAQQDSHLVFVAGQGVPGQQVGQGAAGPAGRGGQRADAEAAAVAEFAQSRHELRFRVHRGALAGAGWRRTAPNRAMAIPAAIVALVPAKVSAAVNPVRMLRQTI